MSSASARQGGVATERRCSHAMTRVLPRKWRVGEQRLKGVVVASVMTENWRHALLNDMLHNEQACHSMYRALQTIGCNPEGTCYAKQSHALLLLRGMTLRYRDDLTCKTVPRLMCASAQGYC